MLSRRLSTSHEIVFLNIRVRALWCGVLALAQSHTFFPVLQILRALLQYLCHSHDTERMKVAESPPGAGSTAQQQEHVTRTVEFEGPCGQYSRPYKTTGYNDEAVAQYGPSHFLHIRKGENRHILNTSSVFGSSRSTPPVAVESNTALPNLISERYGILRQRWGLRAEGPAVKSRSAISRLCCFMISCFTSTI